MDKIRQWMYYFVVGIVSLIALCFLPFIGSSVGLGWNTPNTVVGWIVWVAVKLIVATLNVLIFHCFMEQAKINVKDNKNYIEGREILRVADEKEFIPKSPKEWNRNQYGKKGATIFITTALSTVALTQAILSFDWMSMLTYLFTIVMGLIFGVLQMKTAEEYWTNEFWQYAQQVKTASEETERKTKEFVEMATEKHIHKGNDSTSDNRGTNILEPVNRVFRAGDCSEPMVVECTGNSVCILGGSSSSDTNSVSDNLRTGQVIQEN